MLSPGKYHLLVPTGRAENLAYRSALLHQVKDGGPPFEEAVRRMCAADLLYYTAAFVWQVNPNTKSLFDKVGPFVPWDFQARLLRRLLAAVEDRKDFLIEKSREMGASWLCLILFDWLARFHPHLALTCISHKEEAVDDPNDPNSLFWKLDFLQGHLPGWIQGGVKRAKLSFTYPSGSHLTGEATTKTAGVGGRAAAMMLDEMVKMPQARAILRYTHHTSDCRIMCSTHEGTGTVFYEVSRRPDIRKEVLHWSQHPEKAKGLYRYNPEKPTQPTIIDTDYAFPADHQFVLDGSPTGGPYPGLRSPWYDEKCRTAESMQGVAEDLDINPSGSTEQFFDALTVRRLVVEYAQEPAWEGEVSFDETTGEFRSLVRREGGSLRLWLTPDSKGRVPARRYFIACDPSTGSGATPTCISIGNDLGEKVGEWVDPHTDPRVVAALLVAIAKLFYNEAGEGAKIIWEIPGPGVTITKRVMELGYWNFYRYTGCEGNPRINSHAPTDRPGWVNNKDTARVLLEDYRASLQGGRFLNRSKRSLEQTLEFSYITSTEVKHTAANTFRLLSGARENHGDLVMSDAMLSMLMAPYLRAREKRPEGPADPDPRSLAWRIAQVDADRDEEAWV